jgi:hypothetical protein
MLVGLTLGALGFAGLIAAGRSTSYWVLIPPLVAAGFGMAFTMPAATAAVIEAAPADRAGIASGVLNASRQAGGAIGVALLHADRGRRVRHRAARGDGRVGRVVRRRGRRHRGLSGTRQACVIMNGDEYLPGTSRDRRRAGRAAACPDGPRART